MGLTEEKVARQFDEYVANVDIDVWEYLLYFQGAAANRIVLEIGTRHGVSTAAFLLGVQESKGHVYSVDINPACASLFAGHPQWTFIHADSQREQSKILLELGDQKLDVLFIDGDHSYEAVLNDLNTYGPLVREGGIILCHDVNPDGITDELKAKGWIPEPGCLAAYNEYLATHPNTSGGILSGRAGLGVIRI